MEGCEGDPRSAVADVVAQETEIVIPGDAVIGVEEEEADDSGDEEGCRTGGEEAEEEEDDDDDEEDDADGVGLLMVSESRRSTGDDDEYDEWPAARWAALGDCGGVMRENDDGDDDSEVL
jgi:hypothetical protein